MLPGHIFPTVKEAHCPLHRNRATHNLTNKPINKPDTEGVTLRVRFAIF